MDTSLENVSGEGYCEGRTGIKGQWIFCSRTVDICFVHYLLKMYNRIFGFIAGIGGGVVHRVHAADVTRRIACCMLPPRFKLFAEVLYYPY